MVYQRISNDRKERALYLLLEQGWEIERIVDALAMSEESKYWLRDNSCCKKIPPFSLIRERLALYRDQPISTTALHMNLQDFALTHKHLKRVTTESDDAYRME